MKKLLCVFMCVFFVAASARAADETTARYYMAPSQFNAALEVMDLGLANVFGLFQNATGSFEYEATTKSVGNLRLALDLSSLVTSNADNGRDLAALFASAQYPEISFEAPDSISFAEGKADIRGVLTVHGVSKPFVLEATLNHAGKALGLSMKGTFKRTDFGMSDDPLAKSRFGDTITLMLETQAIKQ